MGHLFGLADRYHELISIDEANHMANANVRGTIPMADLPDPDYKPLDNLMSDGGKLTQMQLSYIFDSKIEPNYPTLVIVDDNKQMRSVAYNQKAALSARVIAYDQSGKKVLDPSWYNGSEIGGKRSDDIFKTCRLNKGKNPALNIKLANERLNH